MANGGSPTCASLPSSMEVKAGKFAYSSESADKVTYPYAKSYCQSKGMKLPMFKTQEEYDALLAVASGKTIEEVLMSILI